MRRPLSVQRRVERAAWKRGENEDSLQTTDLQVYQYFAVESFVRLTFGVFVLLRKVQ